MERSELEADGDRQSESADPLPLEPVVEPRVACPECGATWRGDPGDPCIRCGFDPHPPTPAAATAASVEPAPAASTVSPDTALPRPRTLGRWLWGLGLIALAVPAIGALAGARGLVPASDPVDWPDRIETFARGPLLVGLWGLSGVLALGTVAWLRARPLGDPAVVLGRVLAVVAVGRTAALIAAPWPFVEFAAEALLQAAVYAGGLWLLFRLAWRDVFLTLGLTVGVFMVLSAGAHLITWIAS
ncbi:MAG: hypothetical protein KJO43_06625 [Phycisphaerae bacterium]|nr:hypothetical protein [Phycisphaerae bacterium]NNF43128.1 hypothetical protein [Phycisphaerales bacterium]